MKMKGQIDSVYPPVEETKKKKKSKKSDKKATKKKAHKKSSKTDKDAIKAKKTSHDSSESVKEASSSTSPKTKKADQETVVTTTKSDNELTPSEQPLLEQLEKTTPKKTPVVTQQENKPTSLKAAQETLHSDLTKAPIARASKNSQPLVATNKRQTMRRITRQLSNGEISQGEALKTLRIQVLGLKQEDFATLVGVSRKTLSENENDKGNYTADIINKLFSPFDLKVGLVPC